MAQDPKAPQDEAGATPKIDWDDSKMRSTYANVCTVNGTREEVVLFFGISNPSQSGGPQMRVQLSDRVIRSPFAAKRLAQLLSRSVEAYEQRFGPLSDEIQQQSVAPPTKQ